MGCQRHRSACGWQATVLSCMNQTAFWRYKDTQGMVQVDLVRRDGISRPPPSCQDRHPSRPCVVAEPLPVAKSSFSASTKLIGEIRRMVSGHHIDRAVLNQFLTLI